MIIIKQRDSLPTMETTSGSGSIVLLTRLARVVYRRSTEELLGIRLKELMALASLRDRGVVTDAEFQAKKAELLSRM